MEVNEARDKRRRARGTRRWGFCLPEKAERDVDAMVVEDKMKRNLELMAINLRPFRLDPTGSLHLRLPLSYWGRRDRAICLILPESYSMEQPSDIWDHVSRAALGSATHFGPPFRRMRIGPRWRRA